MRYFQRAYIWIKNKPRWSSKMSMATPCSLKKKECQLFSFQENIPHGIAFLRQHFDWDVKAFQSLFHANSYQLSVSNKETVLMATASSAACTARSSLPGKKNPGNDSAYRQNGRHLFSWVLKNPKTNCLVRQVALTWANCYSPILAEQATQHKQGEKVHGTIKKIEIVRNR